MILNKEGLAKAVNKNTDVPVADVLRVIESIQENIISSIVEGTEVKLMGFLAIEPTDRAPRVYKNPRTGEDIDVPASRGIRVRPMKNFRDRVAGNTN